MGAILRRVILYVKRNVFIPPWRSFSHFFATALAASADDRCGFEPDLVGSQRALPLPLFGQRGESLGDFVEKLSFHSRACSFGFVNGCNCRAPYSRAT